MQTHKEPTIGDISQAITRAWSRYERLRKRGAAPEHSPDWFKILTRKLSRYMDNSGYPVEVRGPFGICCGISVKRKGVRFKRHVAFELNGGNDWNFGTRDYSKDTGEFPPHSIGAINGMNHPFKELPPKTPLSWFIKQLV